MTTPADKLQRTLDLRRSNATTPVPSGKRYTRRLKHPKGWSND